MFTFLHLSDLHRSSADPISNAELVSALIADAERYRREHPSISHPDAVIVSGDLVQGLGIGSAEYPVGLARQYEEALELLILIAKVFLQGDHSRLIFIPGNHDVDWNIAFRSMVPVDMTGKDIQSLLTSPHSRYRWSWKNRQLYQIKDTSLYQQRFDYFEAIYKRFYSGVALAFPLQADRAWNLFSLADGKIAVAAFNSCVSNDCYATHGEIPIEAISESHLSLLSANVLPNLRVAVWHHDIQGPPFRRDYMDSNTIRIMIDKGYRLGLHGHQHKSEAGPQTLLASEKHVMAVVSAGSLCAPPSEIPPGFLRQYNIIEVVDETHARLHVRQAHIRGIFSPGLLPGLGNPSFAEIEWTAVPLGSSVNVGRGGGAAVAVLEEVERLVNTSEYDEAIKRIDSAYGILGNSGRLLKTEALFRQENWNKLAIHLAEPASADELTKAVRALIELKQFEDAGKLLDNALSAGKIAPALIGDLRKTIQAEKAVGK